MSLPFIEELMVSDLTLKEAAAERVRLIKAADPQEQYWAYSAERAAILSLVDRLTQQTGLDPEGERLVMLTMRRLAVQVALFNALQDDLLEKHGELKAFDPVLIERMVSKDIPPLWPNGIPA